MSECLRERRKFLRRLGKRAVLGDVCAQFYLSVMYEGAHGCERDSAKSASWCERASESGDVQSQYRLSKMLRNGFGRPRDLQLSLHWLETAARNGHLEAQYDVGLLYLLGVNGAEKSPQKALRYFIDAANRDHAEAFYYLGHMHCNGIGCGANDAIAAQYYAQASELGSLRAKCVLAFMYSHGQGVERNMRRSAQLYEEAANGGHLGAQFGLACLALLNENFKDARVWLSLASHNGITPAQAIYAKFLVDGPHEYRDRVQSLMWCRIIRLTEERDSDSLLVANAIHDSLQSQLPSWQCDKAMQLADDWLERRSQHFIESETDWNSNIKKEMQFYESKKNK